MNLLIFNYSIIIMLYSKEHAISKRTRRSIWSIIQKYDLDERELLNSGLIDRQIRGYIHAENGNVRISWPTDEVKLDDELYYVCEVVSERDMDNEKSKWRRPYKIGSRFVLKDNVYNMEEVGTDLIFTMRGYQETIHSHSCEDLIFQRGFKGIPTTCYHIAAVRQFLPSKLNDIAREYRLDIEFVDNNHIEIDDGHKDLYTELSKMSKLKSWQRLNVLYAYQTRELGKWNDAEDFKRSIEKYLNDDSIPWEEVWDDVLYY